MLLVLTFLVSSSKLTLSLSIFLPYYGMKIIVANECLLRHPFDFFNTVWIKITKISRTLICWNAFSISGSIRGSLSLQLFCSSVFIFTTQAFLDERVWSLREWLWSTATKLRLWSRRERVVHCVLVVERTKERVSDSTTCLIVQSLINKVSTWWMRS